MVNDGEDVEARRVAEGFARELAKEAAQRFEDGLLGVYLIGSLAHGGFSRRYSDIDVAFVTEAGFAPLELDEIKKIAERRSVDLARKLSIFWTDRSFTQGRFQPLDRIDLLDHGRVAFEREKLLPNRPDLCEVRAYLAGRPFLSWAEEARGFAAADVLVPQDRKPYLRALLYPARFYFSWTQGQIGSNDEAVGFLRDAKLEGLDLDLIERALMRRQAAADPDDLFVERRRLLDYVKACSLWLESRAHGKTLLRQ